LWVEIEGGKECERTLCPKTVGRTPHKPNTLLILFVEACVKKIFHLGENFPWPRLKQCPRCGGRLWGHGFVAAYFDGFDEPIRLRRYRCPDCRMVIRTRPKDYWPRFQASIASIRKSLSDRLTRLRWRPDLPRSRQRHWLTGLIRQVRFHLGAAWSGSLVGAFDGLVALGICPVSRSINREEGSPPR
jgi:DNA-directed RNA polymerase subunit RPC12/RpoP